MQGLALFDFDGTITKKDSLLEFIKFTQGRLGFYYVMGLHSPSILYHLFFKKDGSVAKRQVISFLYRGKHRSKLLDIGKSFCQKIIPGIVYAEALEKIKWHQNQGHRVIVISASLDIWLENWARETGVELICTKMEFDDEKATGHFLSANCNGPEKVSRIKALLDISQYKPIYAYGNSRGDLPMLSLAEHQFFRPFEQPAGR